MAYSRNLCGLVMVLLFCALPVFASQTMRLHVAGEGNYTELAIEHTCFVVSRFLPTYFCHDGATHTFSHGAKQWRIGVINAYGRGIIARTDASCAPYVQEHGTKKITPDEAGELDIYVTANWKYTLKDGYNMPLIEFSHCYEEWRGKH